MQMKIATWHLIWYFSDNFYDKSALMFYSDNPVCSSSSFPYKLQPCPLQAFTLSALFGLSPPSLSSLPDLYPPIPSLLCLIYPLSPAWLRLK